MPLSATVLCLWQCKEVLTSRINSSVCFFSLKLLVKRKYCFEIHRTSTQKWELQLLLQLSTSILFCVRVKVKWQHPTAMCTQSNSIVSVPSVSKKWWHLDQIVDSIKSSHCCISLCTPFHIVRDILQHSALMPRQVWHSLGGSRTMIQPRFIACWVNPSWPALAPFPWVRKHRDLLPTHIYALPLLLLQSLNALIIQ